MNEREQYWERIRRDAAVVAALPVCLRGGAAALAEEREIRELDADIARLRRAVSR